MHGCLARWIDFLTEYEFDVRYKPGPQNRAAGFLSRYVSEEDPLKDNEDEGSLVVTVKEDPEGLEQYLAEIWRKLSG